MNPKVPNRPKSAVSLRYNLEADAAPRVTSKGKGLAAEKIIALAEEHNIPIKEDPDLIEVLSQVEVDQEIPPSVYHVVAELLAFIYQMNKEYSKPS
ncbi:MAG: hypothetical protein NPINA01_12360 [Nitrospinaceae bacterium]|nr:MAG: hypothetical protein NPINA01_12360 [Nitrospinaceae bacterium]